MLALAVHKNIQYCLHRDNADGINLRSEVALGSADMLQWFHLFMSIDRMRVVTYRKHDIVVDGLLGNLLLLFW